MKRLIIGVVLLVMLGSVIPANGQWAAIKQKGSATNGNMIVWHRSGQIMDSGISAVAMTNAAAVASVIGTNTAATVEFTTRKNAPNGYAGLDENGELDASLVETIIVVFVGGNAIDV